MAHYHRILFFIIILWVLLPVKSYTQCHEMIWPDFTYTIGQDGITVTFTSKMGSSECGGYFSYMWDFGDGTSSSEMQPAHTYSSDGTYIVRLKVSQSPPCASNSGSSEQVITISSAHPGALFLKLEGPSLAAECQDVYFTTNVVGGTPPYSYRWDMSEFYCSPAGSTTIFCPCNAPNNPIINNGPSNPGARFLTTGAAPTTISVTVTDARGNTEAQYLSIRVKPGIQPPGIILKTIEDCQNAYKINTPVIMFPDIKPLSAFEYPTDYLWDFGDGTTYLDNVDGGGFAIHKYTACGNYTIKLTISDPYGSMQATRSIAIRDDLCSCTKPGTTGGGSNPETRFGVSVTSFQCRAPTYSMNYTANSVAGIQLCDRKTGGSIGCPANFILYARWLWEFTDAGPDGQPFVVLNTFGADSTKHVLLKDCITNEYMPFTHNFYQNDPSVNLTQAGCNVLTQNKKYWGCLKMTAKIYTDPQMTQNCATAQNNCVVYIQPDELEMDKIEVTGNCYDYIITALPEGGGWKEINGKKMYQEYIWEAIDWKTHEVLTGILEEVPGHPDKKQINLDHQYFKQFAYNQYYEFWLKVTVNDFANKSVTGTNSVTFNPFRHYLKQTYTRCPGVQSKFSNTPLAGGGTGSIDAHDASAYTFVWSGGLTGYDPTFTAPAAGGSQTYYLTVSDGHCARTASTTVTARSLVTDFLPASTQGCAGGGTKKIGPSHPDQIGGSGSYTFAWTPATYLSHPFIANPEVQDIAQNTTYTLKITDIYGGCSVTDQIEVLSRPNTLQVSIQGTSAVCHREEAFLFAHVPGVNPPGNLFEWTSTNKYFKPPLTNQEQIKIDQTMSSVPGPHTFTVRYSDPNTGCFKVANKTVVVRDAWVVTGYESNIHTCVKGTQTALLWDDPQSNSIRGAGGTVIPLTYTWLPTNPLTELTSQGIPVGGTFSPTTSVPYLRLIVTDNQGCIREFKTNRYVITQLPPSVNVTVSPSPVICLNGSATFDITFDASLGDVTSNDSWMPSSFQYNYYLYSPLLQSQKPPVTGIVTMNLVNSKGLYKGTFTESSYFNVPTQLYSMTYRYRFYLVPVRNTLWKNINYDMSLHVSDYDIANDPLATCIIRQGGLLRIKSLTLGIPSCPSGNEMSYHTKIMAKDFIKIEPNAGITLNAAKEVNGPHLLINKCLTMMNMPEGLQRDSAVLAEVSEVNNRDKVNAIDSLHLNFPSFLNLSLYPNPFTGEIMVEYGFGGEEDSDITLRVLDITGQTHYVLLDQQPHSHGAYRLSFNGSHLPAGVYWFELTTKKGLKQVKKAVKTKI